MEPVRIGLIGVGGYARTYFNGIIDLHKQGLLQFTSVAIRTPGKYPEQEKELEGLNVVVRRDFDEMLEKDRDKMEVVGIPTGIDSHRDLMIQAAEAGLHVMLEKPTAATIQDIDAMIRTLDRTGRFCAVGFQGQWDTNVVGVKKAVCEGRIGKVTEAIVLGNWRRLDSYYERNPWAGTFMMDGRYILDGTINNPLAHYLFNALYFSADEWGKAAMPVTVRAELYRAHKIQSEDTSCLEVTCDNGAKVYFYASLCSADGGGPTIEVIGDKGRVQWQSQAEAKVFEGDTLVETIPPDAGNPRNTMFVNLARYHRGLDSELGCPIQMTRAHVLAVNGAFESAGYPVQIPDEHLKRARDEEADSMATELLPDIKELSARAAAERKLYSDLGVPWARKTEPFSLEGYTSFNIQPQSD